MRTTSSALCLGLLLIGSGGAQAAPGDRIGAAVKVVDLVTAALARETRTLATGDGVRQSEVIEVGQNGSSELKLNDDTKLALGPGARLVLDKFVYEADKTGNAIVLNLAKGAFRFITGVAAKPTYVIRTPSASITVRGTIFDVYVQESGQAWILLLEGGVRACNDRGKCRDHDEPGKFLPINDQGEIGNLVRWASLDDKQGFAFDTAFPFVVSPPGVDPSPIFTKDDIVNGTGEKPKKNRRASNDTGTSGDAGKPKATPEKTEKPEAVVKSAKTTKMTKVTKIEKVENTPAIKVVKLQPAQVKIKKRVVKVEPKDDDDDDHPARTASAETVNKYVKLGMSHLPGLIDRIRYRHHEDNDDHVAPSTNSPSTGGVFTSGGAASYPARRPPMKLPYPKPE